MKKIISFVVVFFVVQGAFSETRYVSPAGGNTSPYTSWASAANNIQDAVDAATNGETVVVASGIYNTGARVTPGFTLSNRVVITKNITLESENGPENTIIAGAGPNGDQAIRCVFMTNSAKLVGFTLSNGHTKTSASTLPEYFYNKSGGGAFMVDKCYVSNCFFVNNSADHSGGGLYCYYSGTAEYCRFTYNTAGGGGGVSFYASVSGSSLLENSVVIGNDAAYAGGGVSIDNAHDMRKCFISGNSANNGGGVYLKSFQTVEACTISNNFARNLGGGVYIENSGGHNILTSCLIVDNVATNKGGGVYHYQFGFTKNCTIARNSAGVSGGGIFNYLGGGAINSIMYFNEAPAGTNFGYTLGYPPYSYCCTTPCPWTNCATYFTITNDPEFVDLAANNFRLNEWSACIDTGNTAEVGWGATDLDGNPRIHDGKVDMGCYEYIPEPTTFWILNFGFWILIPFFRSRVRRSAFAT